MGRGARAWAEGMEWAEAEDGQKRWVGRVGGLGRGGFMGGDRGARRLAEGGVGRGAVGRVSWWEERGRGGQRGPEVGVGWAK